MCHCVPDSSDLSSRLSALETSSWAPPGPRRGSVLSQHPTTGGGGGGGSLLILSLGGCPALEQEAAELREVDSDHLGSPQQCDTPLARSLTRQTPQRLWQPTIPSKDPTQPLPKPTAGNLKASPPPGTETWFPAPVPAPPHLQNPRGVSSLCGPYFFPRLFPPHPLSDSVVPRTLGVGGVSSFRGQKPRPSVLSGSARSRLVHARTRARTWEAKLEITGRPSAWE